MNSVYLLFGSTVLYVVTLTCSLLLQTFQAIVWFKTSPQSYQKVCIREPEIYLALFKQEKIVTYSFDNNLVSK